MFVISNGVYIPKRKLFSALSRYVDVKGHQIQESKSPAPMREFFYGHAGFDKKCSPATTWRSDRQVTLTVKALFATIWIRSFYFYWNTKDLSPNNFWGTGLKSNPDFPASIVPFNTLTYPKRNATISSSYAWHRIRYPRRTILTSDTT